MLTGKTISQLTYSASTDPNITIPYELNGQTFHLKYGDLQPSRVFRALLFQTGSITSTEPPIGGLIPGEQYTITNYQDGDDFSPIADVVFGEINTTGCIFIATGTGIGDPNVIWSNGSTLVSLGQFFMNTLENTLGFEVGFEANPSGAPGLFIFYTLTDEQQFKAPLTQCYTQQTPPYDFNLTLPTFLFFTDAQSSNVVLITIDPFSGEFADNLLYYTPITIYLY